MLADLTRVGSDVSITPILTIDGLGSPAFLAKFVSGPMKSGQVLYIRPRFLDQSYSGTIYERIIKFMVNQYVVAPASLIATAAHNKTVLIWPAGTPRNRPLPVAVSSSPMPPASTRQLGQQPSIHPR